jgi:hypothetical protein
LELFSDSEFELFQSDPKDRRVIALTQGVEETRNSGTEWVDAKARGNSADCASKETGSLG